MVLPVGQEEEGVGVEAKRPGPLPDPHLQHPLLQPLHTAGDGIEVLSGLEGGETLVVSASLPLVEGDKVVQ